MFRFGELSINYAHKRGFFQALGFVLIARPEYMLEKDVGKILGVTLSPSCDARLKVRAYVLSSSFPYLFWLRGLHKCPYLKGMLSSCKLCRICMIISLILKVSWGQIQ